jgi:hypothetical protein
MNTRPKRLLVWQGRSPFTGQPLVAIVTGFHGSDNTKTGDMLQLWILRADKQPSQAYGEPVAVPYGILRTLTGLCDGHTGFTHDWRRCSPNYASLLMASCQTAGAAHKALTKGWRVFRILTPGDEPTPHEHMCQGGKTTTCEQCMLCDGGDGSNVAILRHGPPNKCKQWDKLYAIGG